MRVRCKKSLAKLNLYSLLRLTSFLSQKQQQKRKIRSFDKQVISAHRNTAHWPFSTEKPDTDQKNGRKLTFFFAEDGRSLGLLVNAESNWG